MKDAVESASPVRNAEPENFGNRKLIRPSLARTENHNRAENHNRLEGPPRVESGGERRMRPPTGPRKAAPPEQTHAENFYYQKQMQSKTPMVMVLRDGEEIHGMIEWYDKTCIKVTRDGAPNLLIYKPSIKYMYKESEGPISKK
ncbi:MAG TPA: RNA chaperone Hfq [Terriglobales bacterium]|nr:RNA chaperone Hfq [Terriglobales bacterium]